MSIWEIIALALGFIAGIYIERRRTQKKLRRLNKLWLNATYGKFSRYPDAEH